MTEYTTDTEMKNRIGQDANTARLALAITAASKAIDLYTGRIDPGFGIDDATSARQIRTRGNVVTDPDGELLLVWDIATATDLVVEVGDGASWSEVTGYIPEGEDLVDVNEPITGLRMRDGGKWAAPRVRVTAKWGWPEVPAAVADATRILAERLYRRKDAPWGVAGFGETGLARLASEDPDVVMLVGEYQKVGF